METILNLVIDTVWTAMFVFQMGLFTMLGLGPFTHPFIFSQICKTSLYN